MIKALYSLTPANVFRNAVPLKYFVFIYIGEKMRELLRISPSVANDCTYIPNRFRHSYVVNL